MSSSPRSRSYTLILTARQLRFQRYSWRQSTSSGSDSIRMYGLFCPYTDAFADREAYEAWAAETDAATTAIRLEHGVALAGELGQRTVRPGE
nr:organomercurial lyase [Halorientalis sp.]